MRHEDILTFEEIETVVRAGAMLGIDKIRLTGGEPLVRRGILTLVEKIGAIKAIRDFAMTTNGAFLSEFAGPLRRAGLMRLNISLDTLDPQRYGAITRCGDLARVLDGIDAAMAAGFDQIKLCCVVNESAEEADAKEVGVFAAARGLSVQFIRKMDMASGRFWPVIGGNGGDCVRCNRLRLSSDGFIYPCLFSDLRYSVRNMGPEEALRQAVEHKPASGHKSANHFYAIGG